MPHWDGGEILTLSQIPESVANCATNTEIFFKTDTSMGGDPTEPKPNGPVGKWVPANNELWLNLEVDWLKPNVTPQGAELSLYGVFMHEMGHSVGAAHAGNEDWTFDSPSDRWPTIAEGTNAEQSDYGETLSQDDRGIIQWLGQELWANGRFYSDDPSFEGLFPGSYARHKPSSVLHNDGTFNNGDFSVKLLAVDAGLYITSVFDPWKSDVTPAQEHAGRDPQGNGKHRLQAYTRFKETPNGDEVEIGYQYAYVPWDPDKQKGGGSKLVGVLQNFSSYTTKVCLGASGGWESCHKALLVDLDLLPITQGNVAFRARVRAEDPAVRVDRFGARRRDY